jgi:hypothetical protein
MLKVRGLEEAVALVECTAVLYNCNDDPGSNCKYPASRN